MKLLVIGGGAAGVAAAWQARQLGAEVRLLHAEAGATELGSGAADLLAWTHRRRAFLTPGSQAFLSELGVWILAPDSMIATGAGVVRPASAADAALLNLAPLAGKRVLVPDVERDDWDARLLVRTLRESSWTRATGTRFDVVEVPLLQHGHERRIAVYDFAALHDEPARHAWFCKALRRQSTPDAWLVGPWLGLEPDTLRACRQQYELCIGETTSPPGGPAGARFARARARLLDRLGVDRREQRVRALAHRGTRWEALLESGEALHAEAVVLAVGGVAAGGIVLDRAPSPVSAQSFRLAFEAPVELLVNERRAETVSSAHGFDFAVHGLSVLEQVGVRPSPESERQGLAVAGDVMAGRPNTVLMAVEAGIAAANALCGETRERRDLGSRQLL